MDSMKIENSGKDMKEQTRKVGLFKGTSWGRKLREKRQKRAEEGKRYFG